MQNTKTSKNQLKKRYTKELTEAHHLEAITNLSSRPISTEERRILNLGLSFAPAHTRWGHDYITSTRDFCKRLATRHYFRDKPKRKIPIFKLKSNWNPPKPKIKEYIQLEKDLIEYSHTLNREPTTILDNFTTEEKRALKNLINDKEIVIQPADKGGSIVIQDTRNYITQVLEHLSDTTVYQERTRDETKDIATLIDTYLSHLLYSYQLDESIVKYLYPDKHPRTPVLYCLKKIHKENQSLRPIVSGCDSPTERISHYISTILTPIAKQQKSYLKDTKHLLQIIDELDNVGEDTLLCTADVGAMYSNIPHEEGISAAMEALSNFSDHTPQHTAKPAIIQKFLEFILERNTFTFLDRNYLQILGCAMGTRAAPPYANIFMARLEEILTSPWENRLELWKRFLDDIFFLFRGSLTNLNTFITEANTLHPTIKFEFTHSRTAINFLDLHIYKDAKNKLQTTIYRKPCNKNLLLHFKSDHPLQLKKSIIYSQALRLKRIISEPKNLQQELTFLARTLIARGYPRDIIHHQLRKISFIPRSTLIQDKIRKYRTGPVYIYPGNCIKMKYMKLELRKKWKESRNNTILKKFWSKEPLLFTKRSGPNLKSLLVHSNQLKRTSTQLLKEFGKSGTPIKEPYIYRLN